MKKVITITITFIFILSFALPCYAMIDMANIDYNNYVTISITEDGEEQKNIQKTQMKQLKNKTKMLSKEVVSKNIMETIGINVSENAKIHSVMVEYYEETEEIYLKEKVFKVENNIEIGDNSNSNSRAVSGTIYEDNEPDDALCSSLVALYIGKQTYNGQANTPTYIIMASHYWETEPITKARDAFSIYADGEIMPSGLYNDHMAVLQYNYSILGEEQGDVIVDLTPEIKAGSGVAAECDLSKYVDNSGLSSFDDYYFALSSKYIITDTSSGSKTFRIWTKYVHSWLGLSLDIGWDVGADLPGVTISPSFQTTEYGFFIDISTGADYT